LINIVFISGYGVLSGANSFAALHEFSSREPLEIGTTLVAADSSGDGKLDLVGVDENGQKGVTWYAGFTRECGVGSSSTMTGTKRVDVRLLTGKCMAVTITTGDEVLVIGGARDLAFLLAAETLVDYLRQTYRPACDPVPRELRRTAGGLVLVGATAGFRLKRRERLAYFEVAPEVVRDMLERADRDPREIARWSAPPRTGAKTTVRKRTTKSEGIAAVVQSLATSGPWGWTAPQVARSVHCSVGFFYRFLREHADIRRLWQYYQSEGRGKGPASLRDL
jgi:hypothetical protein